MPTAPHPDRRLTRWRKVRGFVLYAISWEQTQTQETVSTSEAQRAAAFCLAGALRSAGQVYSPPLARRLPIAVKISFGSCHPCCVCPDQADHGRRGRRDKKKKKHAAQGPEYSSLPTRRGFASLPWPPRCRACAVAAAVICRRRCCFKRSIFTWNVIQLAEQCVGLNKHLGGAGSRETRWRSALAGRALLAAINNHSFHSQGRSSSRPRSHFSLSVLPRARIGVGLP